MTEASLPEPSLAQLQRQLDAARAELQEFTYTVSHDLRAPLRHINAFAQIIAEDWPEMPAEMAGHLGTIRQSAQLLTAQLDGLTQLSRLGQHPVNLQPVDVNTLVKDVADELTLQHPQQAVQWRLAGDVPQVTADAALLRQVLAHVLGNALKFSSHRLPALIEVTWQQTGKGLCCIRVQDNGVGFAPEQAGKLFKVFAKLHPAREFEGLGLGLVTSRKIIERLGGAIQISGQTDGGCCLSITLTVASPGR